MVPEGFTAVHVGQVHLDERNPHRQQSVAQCHAGVGERGRVEQNEIDAFRGGAVDAFDQFVLGVALQMLQVVSGLGGLVHQCLIDLRQGGGAVLVRLAAAQQVQVGPVQDEDASQGVYP